MQPQPPTDAPAPPPSDAAILSRKKWKWMWAVGAVSIFSALFVGLAFTSSRHHDIDRTETMHNARSVGFALFEFEDRYGKFPDVTTLKMLPKISGVLPPAGGGTSNEIFRQLFAEEIVWSENLFYAKGRGVHRPDQIFAGARALEKGECGFTFFGGASGKDRSDRPLLVAPMIPGTDRFDPNPFGGKAVVLRLDGSVTSLSLDKDGHVFIGGRNMMDTHHPIWDGYAPVIAWPDL